MSGKFFADGMGTKRNNRWFIRSPNTEVSLDVIGMKCKEPSYFDTHFIIPTQNISCDRNTLKKEFTIFLKIFSLVGITMCPKYGPDKRRFSSCRFYRSWDYLMTVSALCLAIISFISIENFSTSIAMGFTTCINMFFALCIRLSLFYKRQEILKVIKKVSKLWSEVSPTPYPSLKHRMLFQCFVTLSLMATVLFLSLTYISTRDDVWNSSQVYLLGWNFTVHQENYILDIFLPLFCLNYAMNTGISCLCLILCCSIHKILKRIIETYGKNLKERVIHVSSEALSDDTSFVNTLISITSYVDTTLSQAAFFLYSSTVSSLFHTISIILSEHIVHRTVLTISYDAFIFSMTVTMFLLMTLSASSVSKKYENLKQDFLNLAEATTRKPQSIQSFMALTVLMNTVKDSHIVLTGWGMFSINRSFILTTAGVMVTYGVLIFQFNY